METKGEHVEKTVIKREAGGGVDDRCVERKQVLQGEERRGGGGKQGSRIDRW